MKGQQNMNRVKILLTILAVLFCLGGCANSGVSTAPTTQPTGTATTPAPAEPATVAFISSMGCNDVNCTDLTHNHHCEEHCTDSSHHHGCTEDECLFGSDGENGHHHDEPHH